MNKFQFTEKWFRQVLNSISDAILIVDKEGVVQFVNRSYTRLKGIQWDEIVGKKLTDVRTGRLLPTVMETKIPIIGLYRKVDGVEFSIDVTPILEGGEVVGGVSVSKDINHIRQLIEKHKHAIITYKAGKSKSFEQELKSVNFGNIPGNNLHFKKTLEIAQKASFSDTNVLIYGEIGTEKELIAHAIHNASERANGYFVVVNCHALSNGLLENELFGHEPNLDKKSQKLGLFEVTSGGTIFFDEIGDISLTLQAKLLQVLQEKKFHRIGGAKEIQFDVRIIAATNYNLEEMVKAKLFREDLFSYLNGISISIPPLRDRKEDIPFLANHFLGKFNKQLDKQTAFSPETINYMMEYEWPGNTQELKSTIQSIVKTINHPIILPNDFPHFAKEQTISQNINPKQIKPLAETIANSEKQAILEALEVYGLTTEGKRQAANSLGVSLATLYNKI